MLKGSERKYLRGLAHDRKPIVQVGQGGVTDAVVTQTEEQLLAHELIKVRMREPTDKKSMAQNLAERAGAELCGLVGHTAILYRPHPDKPRITLPKRSLISSGE